MIKERIVRFLIFIFALAVIIFIISFNKNYHFDKVINSNNSFNKYRLFNYISIDMTSNSKYRLSNEDIKSDNYDAYIINYGDKDILILLKKNSQIEDIVNVKKKKDNKIASYIRKNVSKIDKNINLVNDYYTNDFRINYDIARIKLLVLYAIVGLLLFLILKEIVLLVLKK